MEDDVLKHIRQLGVSSVELLPVHAFVNDQHLLQKGMTNYWGYNSIAFFAPDPRYLASGKIAEFKEMVAHLHEQKLEVILDVVYNHTAEGNERGPTLPPAHGPGVSTSTVAQSSMHVSSWLPACNWRRP
ncbi:alpha-amylase family glycosyl hydrolase, partial [Klebsiella pneumoniae]